MRRLLGIDPLTEKRTVFHALPDGRFVVETQVDVEAIVENATVLRNAAPSGFRGDGLHHVGSIPMPLWQRLRAEGRAQDPKAIQRWLNEHQKFQIKRVTR